RKRADGHAETRRKCRTHHRRRWIKGREVSCVIARHEISHDVLRDCGCPPVKARELDVSLARLIERAHPIDHVKDFFCVPRPEVHLARKLGGIAGTAEDVVVEAMRLFHAGFDRENRKAHLRRKKLQYAMLELEELTRAKHCLVEGDDACAADEWLEALKI